MAIGINASDKQVVGALFTGIATVKVSAINPSKDALIAMGINAQKEPEYLTQETKDGVTITKLRVDFYLSHPTINLSKALKYSVWLEDRVRTNQGNNKEQFVNKVGTLAWNTGLGTTPNYTWFSMDGARKAYVGEEGLIKFIKAWCNLDQNSQAILDDITKVLAGDLSELHTIHAQAKNNLVKVLLGVKDGKYQDVYPKYFERPYVTNIQGFKKELEAQGGEFKSDYQNDLAFKPYVGSTAIAGDSPTDFSPIGSAKMEF